MSLPIPPKLKHLEKLSALAAKLLHALAAKNAKLLETAKNLEEENQKLRDSLRQAQASLTRHEKVKSKLERIVHKLEKAG